MADDTLRCGISAFRTYECGCYYLFPHEYDAIIIKCCVMDVTSHLKSVWVATGGSYRHFSLGESMTEGLCRSCSKKVAPSTIEDTKDLDTTEEEKTETSSCLSIMNIDGESSAKTDTQPSTADTDFLTFSQDDDASIAKTETQPSTAETDSMTFSQDLSQTSSWSTDEKKGDILLDDVNTALSLLSNATTAIDALMDCLAPGQASKLTELIKMEKQHSPVPDLTTTIGKLYENTYDCNMKKQMLSMLAKDYTKNQLQKMFPGLTIYGIDQARLHASVHGEGQLKWNQRDETEYWRKEFNIRSGSNCLPCQLGPHIVSFEILRVCPASKRTSLRGLDNIATDGSTAFDNLDEVKKQLKPNLTEQVLISID
ncbi:unnamed protein product [Mytilus edulis]|uniref:Uncharacterized protein n=1 Tax=Mytilus edulis TaxID=6550 RepID=A0A8S3SYS7_MYTED|nr:unnamed protein product [Mytilus edulis]